MTLSEQIHQQRAEYIEAELELLNAVNRAKTSAMDFFVVKFTAERLAHHASVLSKSLEEKERL